MGINYITFILLQAIQENPQQFISLLNEGASEGGDATGGLPPAAGGGGGGAPNQPLPGTMQITREEKEAIDRVSIKVVLRFNDINWEVGFCDR